MSLRNKMTKIIQWFFEKDDNDPADIALGPLQIAIIIMIGIFLFWISFKPNPLPKSYINAHIEKNYFKHNSGLKNSDFSQGLNYWATSDGGTLFPDSKSIASIENKDFHSAPSSLKIECIFPASRYHYSKKAVNGLVNNAYSFKQTECWLGVLPGKQLTGSFWYKGDIIKFSINYLRENRQWKNLASVGGMATSQWAKLEINKKLPADARAIMLEITLNQALDMPAPVVWIDDVILKIGN